MLNYSPAIVEAYYQKVPLLVLTGDRPTEWIDQDDGQTMRQNGIYKSFAKASYTLPTEGSHADDLWYAQRVASEAFNNATEKGNEGPVHINIPLREPLYVESGGMNNDLRTIEVAEVSKKLNAESEKEITTEWKKAKRKMVICGLHRSDKELNELLSKLANDASVVVITETTSNMFNDKFVCNVDGYFESLTEIEKKALQPDLLITLGGPVTTKKFKAYLRKNKATQHWHLSVNKSHTDTYQSLTKVLPVDEIELFSLLVKQKREGKSTYAANVRKIAKGALEELDKYAKQIPFSDFKAFEIIWKHLPKNSNVQLGNSTPIRYANLLDAMPKSGMNYFSNRGVSGIDGSLSTAVGAAYASDKITTLIVGDLGFMYDMNGLWNKNLSSNLRIIVINNGGGGIFRVIDSKETPLLEQYFEAAHNQKIEPFAKAFGIEYCAAQDKESLRAALSNLYGLHSRGQGTKPIILEIFTPRTTNADVLLGYFKFLKK